MSLGSGDGDGGGVGYRRPPAANRFSKGQSGNPHGRPCGRRNEAPYEAVLGQRVTIREDGVERRVTAAEAFLLHMTKRGLSGDGAAARAAMAAIEDAGVTRVVQSDGLPTTIVLVIVGPGSVSTAIEPLRIGRKLDRYRDSTRVALEPWIVEAALARIGGSRLSIEEQRIVVRAVRTPWKVAWPHWWEVRPHHAPGS